MLVENDLSYEEFHEIINTIGWKMPSERLLKNGLKNSLTVKYVVDKEAVGMARLITDTGYIALLADVVVKPKYQGQGIGKKMVCNLLEQAKCTLEEGEQMMIQLLAADGKKEFYHKFGFKDRKEVVEAGMYMWIQNH